MVSAFVAGDIEKFSVHVKGHTIEAENLPRGVVRLSATNDGDSHPFITAIASYESIGWPTTRSDDEDPNC
jgi:hypothetical protein